MSIILTLLLYRSFAENFKPKYMEYYKYVHLPFKLLCLAFNSSTSNFAIIITRSKLFFSNLILFGLFLTFKPLYQS